MLFRTGGDTRTSRYSLREEVTLPESLRRNPQRRTHFLLAPLPFEGREPGEEGYPSQCAASAFVGW